MANLLYIADPLCSWCYGFGPELARLLAAHRELRLHLVMGGLRPYNREPMSAAFRQMLRTHWAHVAQASGLPFSEAIFARADFVYDTEPPCRAVVTAREIDAARAFPYMKAIQAAFYGAGTDVTDAGTLADLAAQCGYEREAFSERFASEAMEECTRADFATAQALGVSGFPTLAVEYGPRELYLVASGFTPAAVLSGRIEEIARRMAAR